MGFKFNAAKSEADERNNIVLGWHNATIEKVSVDSIRKGANIGAPRANFRWKFTDGTNADKAIFDKLQFIFDSVGFNVNKIESYCASQGKDAAVEFGDNEITEAFLWNAEGTGWAQQQLGEMATLEIGMGKPSTGDDGTAYPARPEVKSYKPFGAGAKTGNDLIDLD